MEARTSRICSTILKIGKVDLVTHDIGNMVGYAFAAQNRDRITRFVSWTRRSRVALGRVVRSRALWHFSFQGPMPSGLVAAATDLSRPVLERVLRRSKELRRASREHYAQLYALPGAMHAGSTSSRVR